MEGVSKEAASIAGHLGLGAARLLLRRQPHHDRRHDLALATRPRTRASASRRTAGTSSPSTTPRTSPRSRRRSRAAQAETERPSLVIVRSHIAYRRPEGDRHREVARLAARRGRGARGEGGARLRPGRALPRSRRGLRAHGRRAGAGSTPSRSGSERFERWSERVSRGCARSGTPTARGEPRPGWLEALPVFPAGEDVATRDAGKKVMQALKPFTPTMIGGAADLVESTKTEFEGAASSPRRTPAATSPSASASTRWARS